MKALYTYILSVCFLLLNGASPVLAASLKENNAIAATAQQELDIHFSTFGQEHNDHLVLKSFSANIEKQLDKIEITESEDQEDETIHYRKLLEVNNYLVVTSCVHTFGFFQHWKNARLTFFKHFTAFTSYKSLAVLFCTYRL